MTKNGFVTINDRAQTIDKSDRFQRHEQFPFLVFGVCQKQRVCHFITLQMKKSSFKKHESLLVGLKPEDFRQASKEEKNLFRMKVFGFCERIFMLCEAGSRVQMRPVYLCDRKFGAPLCFSILLVFGSP